MKGKVMPKVDIAYLFDKKIQKLKQSSSVGTMMRYNTVKNKLQEFSPNLVLNDITPQFLYRWQQHLREKNVEGTVKTNITCLAQIWKDAFNSGTVSGPDPFATITYKNLKSAKKDVLSISEIELLESTTGKTEMENIARDVFLFSYYTAGMRFTDVLLFNQRMIQDGVIIYTTRKTDKDMYIPVHDKLKLIIDRYHGDGTTMWALINETNEIKKYKEIGRLQINIRNALQNLIDRIGIKKHITMHCARHSFAQHATDNGVSLYNVKSALGHSNVATTEAYLRKNNDMLKELFYKTYGK